jgi:hypothetical protein
MTYACPKALSAQRWHASCVNQSAAALHGAAAPRIFTGIIAPMKFPGKKEK